MSLFTYKSLYQYVEELVDKRNNFSTIAPYDKQLDRTAISPVVESSRYDASTGELITAIQNMLSGVMPPRIIEGLTVKATTPISDKVIVEAGSGTVGGWFYTLTEDIELTIPFDVSTEIFYLVLYKDAILIEKSYSPDKLTIAKIVVTHPEVTGLIQDTKDRSWNSYIVNFKEYKLYGDDYGHFEDDTIELLRDNIAPLLADNLTGNIRLTEDLKIINTAGTVELNSEALKFYDRDNTKLSEFNTDGVYFYDATTNVVAHFTRSGARIGNIDILPESLQSSNFVAGSTGFQIKSDGNVEFNNLTVRGTVYATAGEIGGFTIEDDKLYGGTIQTGEFVSAGENGVVMDSAGLRVYDDVLGLVVNLPSDGSAPTFSSGTITEVTFEISTNSVLRTSETVGDGTSSSYGILINNSGIYGCGANQFLSGANFKILNDGSAYFKGEIEASTGKIGSVTITAEKLSGGLIEGALIRSPIIENTDGYPKIRWDADGISYMVTPSVGKFGTFTYGSGTKFGVGTLAYLLNTDYPLFAVTAEHDKADIRLYDRTDDPGSGTGPHVEGDLICVDGYLKICESAGSPGVFKRIFKEDSQTYGLIIENRNGSDPTSPADGQIWLRTDL